MSANLRHNRYCITESVSRLNDSPPPCGTVTPCSHKHFFYHKRKKEKEEVNASHLTARHVCGFPLFFHLLSVRLPNDHVSKANSRISWGKSMRQTDRTDFIYIKIQHANADSSNDTIGFHLFHHAQLIWTVLTSNRKRLTKIDCKSVNSHSLCEYISWLLILHKVT